MKPAKHISDRIFRNVLLSLFIYALPVLLMLITFYITGERPWKTYKAKVENAAKKP
jgi:hypothetical protein